MQKAEKISHLPHVGIYPENHLENDSNVTF